MTEKDFSPTVFFNCGGSPMTYPQTAASIAPEEIARFTRQASTWWDPAGPFRALHELTPMRESYICGQIDAHCGAIKGLRVLDLGCGGGLMAEALARCGASVTGIDASSAAIDVARAHAKDSGLSIDYRVTTAESLAESEERFDVITALEIVEHVRDLASFMKASCTLLKPDGLILVATMNRTRRSFLLGIVAAEYLLNWVAAGTHDWDKFVKPVELESLWRGQGVEPVDLTGFVYKPLKRAFELEKGRVSVNYFMSGVKRSHW